VSAHRGATSGSTRTFGWRAWVLGVLGAATLIVPAAGAGTASAKTTWLCKPGLAENPCEASEETTVELGNGGSSVEQAQPAGDPPIDCFYVYPTVSSQLTVNANEEVGAEEKQVAIDQASRFSQQCRVYAPIYPQLTLFALENPGDITVGDQLTAYVGVFEAFEEYLTKYNEGRGFVLIGHSQGALMLKELIKTQIDPSPALREHLVSAVLLGGNVLVPKGAIVGGDFQNVPACEQATETHCVVAYSSFLKEPPPGADFGRVSSPLLGAATPEQIADDEVLCVNPTLPVQGAGAGALLRYESTTPLPLPGFTAPKGSTPWVSMPNQYTAQCDRADGATWLQLNYVGQPGDEREQVTEALGELWGTHLQDVNVALGNLVAMTAQQSATYQAEAAVPPESPPSTPAPVSSPEPAPVPPPAPPSAPPSGEAVKPTIQQVKPRKPASKKVVHRQKHAKHATKRKAGRHKRPAHGGRSPARGHGRPAH
jgi:Protein of unknown function (DUF3089)